MNLHRTHVEADWEATPRTKRNQWQTIAATTSGILTPGNLLSFVGLLLVLYALEQIIFGSIWNGVICLVIGRLCDTFDGLVADLTSTKSPLGELIDASTDKVATILTLSVLALMQIVPLPILIGLLIPHLLIPIVIYIKRRHGGITHPSRLGKLSMAGLWVSVISFLIEHALPSTMPGGFIIAVYIITLWSIVSGFIVLRNYAVQPIK